MVRNGKLVLEDGSVFPGKLIGSGSRIGEVVFTTGMNGYQETMTDPSFCDQIVMLTYPLAGNYGVAKKRNQGDQVAARGMIVSEIFDLPDHWESEESFSSFLGDEGTLILCGVDTRALTLKIRNVGAVVGILVDEEVSVEEALKQITNREELSHPVRRVTCKSAYEIAGEGMTVAVLDFGIKKGILSCLSRIGLNLKVFPASATKEEILAINPSGIFLSNGPGDPQKLDREVALVKELIGTVPMFGICLGHQLLTLASGGNTYKMKFGHRGTNHPVKDLETGKIAVTAQNHGYAVDDEKVPEEWVVTHRSVNDDTIEGLRHKTLPIFSVQYHPEAQAGPQDTEYLFDQFVQMMEKEASKCLK